MNLLRGDVWWVDLNPSKGSEIHKKRPCVIFSADALNQRRKTVVVVPLSTSPVVRPPLTVAVSVNGRQGVAVIDQLRATAKERFASRMGHLSEVEMEAISEALKVVLEII